MAKKDKKNKNEDPPLNAKEELSDFFRTAVFAVLLALVIRSFLYEPFNIPSGSMKPTLEIGDYIFVHKPSYGYSKHSFPFGIAPIDGRIMAKTPQRGDVIVFKLPSNERVDYIKRIVAMPGETVQVKKGRLYIDDKAVKRERIGSVEINDMKEGYSKTVEYIETLPGGVIHNIYEDSDSEALDNTIKYTVPEAHYFVMGDNRDNSQDSRVTNAVGPIPFENIVGRADFTFFSVNGKAGLFQVWKWPKGIRYDRFFKSIDPIRP